MRVISDQWKERFSYRPVLAETYTDIEAFQGTCYKAANWIGLGVCVGNSRVRGQGTFYTPNGKPKKLWVKEIDCNGLKTFTDTWDVAKTAYESETTLHTGELISWDEAHQSIEDLVCFFETQGLFPIDTPL